VASRAASVQTTADTMASRIESRRPWRCADTRVAQCETQRRGHRPCVARQAYVIHCTTTSYTFSAVCQPEKCRRPTCLFDTRRREE
jgi:hypothetical protein